jgi:hypothetical protein
MALAITNLGGPKPEASTMSEDGLITIASELSAKDTLDRLEANLRAKGITVFARIDHAAGAASVGMQLRPTELLILRESESRDAINAVQPDDRHRLAAENPGLARCEREGMAEL